MSVLPKLSRGRTLLSVCVAVVTGGGSGIGTMFAAAYVQNGAKVYIASRKEKQLKEVSIVNLSLAALIMAEWTIGGRCFKQKGPG